jgi:hypothetical protein
MLMFINDFLFVCMLLVCHLCYHHHVFEREIERDQVKPWSQSTFSLLVVYFQLFKSKKKKYCLLIPCVC